MLCCIASQWLIFTVQSTTYLNISISPPGRGVIQLTCIGNCSCLTRVSLVSSHVDHFGKHRVDGALQSKRTMHKCRDRKRLASLDVFVSVWLSGSRESGSIVGVSLVIQGCVQTWQRS